MWPLPPFFLDPDLDRRRPRSVPVTRADRARLVRYVHDPGVGNSFFIIGGTLVLGLIGLAFVARSVIAESEKS